jgi:hypothetical protein
MDLSSHHIVHACEHWVLQDVTNSASVFTEGLTPSLYDSPCCPATAAARRPWQTEWRDAQLRTSHLPTRLWRQGFQQQLQGRSVPGVPGHQHSHYSDSSPLLNCAGGHLYQLSTHLQLASLALNTRFPFHDTGCTEGGPGRAAAGPAGSRLYPGVCPYSSLCMRQLCCTCMCCADVFEPPAHTIYNNRLVSPRQPLLTSTTTPVKHMPCRGLAPAAAVCCSSFCTWWLRGSNQQGSSKAPMV